LAVIKSNNAPTTLSPFSMKDIEEQARSMLVRARARAEQLIADAQRQGEILKTRAHLEGQAEGRKTGHAKGFEEGRNAGEEAALNEHRAKLSELISSLTIAASELNTSRQRLEAEADTEVLKLAVAIARRATHRQVAGDASIVLDSVRSAMRLVVHACNIRIAVHPQSRATLNDAIPKLKAEWPTLQHVELLDDVSLAPGGCRIFTNAGEVDADLDQQIDRIASELVPAPHSDPLPEGEGAKA